jgi:hypothetical protein
LNIDDYYNLPNKQFEGDRATSAYQDRQLLVPVLKIWPNLNQQGFYNGTVTALTRRYIQDPGALTNAVEVPQRWCEALIWRLAVLLLFELPPRDQSQGQASVFTAQTMQAHMQLLDMQATKAEALAWSEERVRAPIRWAPNISPYTA